MKRTDLAKMFRDGPPPKPEMMAGGMVYPGFVHLLSGHPDTGKTTLALWWALQVIRAGGRVMFLDEEGGHRITYDRLFALGWTEQDCESLWYYEFPSRSKKGWTSDGWGDLAADLNECRPAMILVDSAAKVLAAAGIGENTDEVSVVWRLFTLVSRGPLLAAVVVIDHVTKNPGEGQANRYSRGHGSKLADSDVHYKMDVIRPWSREQDGEAKLTVVKDKPGWLARQWHANVRRGPLRFEFDERPVDDDGNALPTFYMETVAEAMEQAQEQAGWKPMSQADIEKLVTGKADPKRRAVKALVKLGCLAPSAGPRGTVWTLVKRYPELTPVRRPGERAARSPADPEGPSGEAFAESFEDLLAEEEGVP